MDVPADFATLWDDVEQIQVPLMLVRGVAHRARSSTTTTKPSCCRRQPDARVELVDGAGHSIQGDRPLELAALLADFVDG